MNEVQPLDLRTVMAKFITGITVLTTGGPEPHAMTANALTSLSLDPALVLVCVAKGARMHSLLSEQGSFGVSVLSSEQQDLAARFASSRRPRGLAQFDGVSWKPGPQTQAPILQGSVAWLECALHAAYPGGDHTIFVGRVLTAEHVPGMDPLAFHEGVMAPYRATLASQRPAA